MPNIFKHSFQEIILSLLFFPPFTVTSAYLISYGPFGKAIKKNLFLMFSIFLWCFPQSILVYLKQQPQETLFGYRIYDILYRIEVSLLMDFFLILFGLLEPTYIQLPCIGILFDLLQPVCMDVCMSTHTYTLYMHFVLNLYSSKLA